MADPTTPGLRHGLRLHRVASHLHRRGAAAARRAVGAAAHTTRCAAPSNSQLAAAAGRGPLSPEQVAQYVRDGFLVVDGLVPPAVVSAAEAVLWDAMATNVTCEGDPYATSDRQSISRAEVDAASHSTGGWVGLLEHQVKHCLFTVLHSRWRGHH